MSTDYRDNPDARRAPRYSCEHPASIIDRSGRIFSVDLINLSKSGGQLSAGRAVGEELSKRLQEAGFDRSSLSIQMFLPFGGDDDLIEGPLRLVYCQDVGDGFVIGVEFLGLLSNGIQRLTDFINTCLRYAE